MRLETGVDSFSRRSGKSAADGVPSELRFGGVLGGVPSELRFGGVLGGVPSELRFGGVLGSALCLHAVIALLLMATAGCGGGGSSSAASSNSSSSAAAQTSGAGSASSTTNAGGALLTTPTTVSVGGGANVSGIDIQVPSAAASFNATLTGVTAPNVSQASLLPGGVGMRQGGSYWLWVSGTGVSSALHLSISGPGDISQSGTPLKMQSATGAIWPLTVGANAALGGRTLALADDAGNIVTLTGGLEVCSATATTC